MEGRLGAERERRRRRAAHNGLILTFLSGPGFPVSFQMNGNCPAGFNHVLNWRKNRRKELLQQLRIDCSGSQPIATPLYHPSQKRTRSWHTCTDLHVRAHVKGEKRQLRWCLGGKEDKRQGRESEDRGKREVASTSNSGVQAPILASECQLWQETERRIIVSSRVWLPSLPLLSMNKAPFAICISFNFMVALWRGYTSQP